MDHFRTSRSRKMPTSLSASSKGSLQKRFGGKHKKETAQSKRYMGTKTATAAAESPQSSTPGLLEPSIAPITTNTWGLVRVYFGSLNPETVYKTVLVNPQTTAKDVVTMVIKSLPRLPKGTTPDDLSLQEMQESSQGSYYRVLSNSECPLINQSKWEEPSNWSFRLSWRSKSVERILTGTPIGKVDAHSNEHLEELVPPSGDHNPDNACCSHGALDYSYSKNDSEALPFSYRGRPVTLSDHSRGSLKSPPQGLSQEQQQRYIEISKSISGLEAPTVGSCKLQSKGEGEEEEEEGEEVIIIEMQEEEEERRPSYETIPPWLTEEDSQANDPDLSLGKFTQQLALGSKSNTPSRITAGPNSNYSNANWNGIGDSHIDRVWKPATARKRRLVTFSHTTVDSADLANEPANCPPSESHSPVTSSNKANAVQEKKYAPPKPLPSDKQQQSSFRPFAGRALKPSVSCPSLQERWQVLGAEISAALQTGMSGVMQRVIQEGHRQPRRAQVPPRRSQSMGSYPRKEWQQRHHVRQVHVAGLHPVIFEDEASDEGEGRIQPTGEITREAGAPASWCENGGENVSDDADAGGCLDRTPAKRFEAFVVVTVAEGDRLEITDIEKGRGDNDSTSDAVWLEDSVFSSSAHDASSTSSCRTSSDLPCSTDEGISSPSPLPSSKASSTSGWKERMDSKRETGESTEFEEEVVNIPFLDNSSESSGSSSGRSSPYRNDQLPCDHHGNVCHGHRTVDGRNGMKADAGPLMEGEDCVRQDDQGTTNASLKDGMNVDHFMDNDTQMKDGNDGSEPQLVPLVLDFLLEAHQGQGCEPESRMEQELLQRPLCQEVSEETVYFFGAEGAVPEEENEEDEEGKEAEREGNSSVVDRNLIHKEVDVDCHTAGSTMDEHNGCTHNHSGFRQAHALGEHTAVETVVLVAEDKCMRTQMTEVIRVSQEDISWHSSNPLSPRPDSETSVQCTNIEAADSTNGNKATEASAKRVATLEAVWEEAQPHDTLKPNLEPVRFSSPTSFYPPLSKRDLDVDADFLLWDGSDTGFIDDDDNLLPSTPIPSISQERSLATPPAMISPNTPADSVGLSLPSKVAVISFTSETDNYWEGEDEEGDIGFGCGEYYNNEWEEPTSPDDVPLETLLALEMAQISLVQSQSTQSRVESGSGVSFLSAMMEEQLALSDLYAIKEDPFMEEIEEREYSAMHQTLWEAAEEEEEEVEAREREEKGSFWNGQGVTVEDDHYTSGSGLRHWDSLQCLSDFLEVPPHLLADVESRWTNDPIESVQSSVNYTTNVHRGSDDTEEGDCIMDDKESMNDALEEAMALELDLDQSLQENDSFSSQSQSKEFGSGDTEVKEETVSCSMEHPLSVPIPDDNSSHSIGLHSELELKLERPPQDQMFNDTATLELLPSASLEPNIHSNAVDASLSPDREAATPQAPYIMPPEQPNPNASPTLNDSMLAHLVKPWESPLWNVSVAAIKRKLMGSMGSEQSFPSPSPSPVSIYRTLPTTMDTCELEENGGNCPELAHIQSLDRGVCFELTMSRMGGATETDKTVIEASQIPRAEHLVQGVSPEATKLIPTTPELVASFPVTVRCPTLGISGEEQAPSACTTLGKGGIAHSTV